MAPPLIALLAFADPVFAQQAPDFTLRNLTGQSMALSDHHGQVVVLAFFSSCCAGCVQQMRTMQALHEDLADDGLVVLAISMDDARTSPRLKPFVRRHGLTMPVLTDRDSMVVTSYNPTKIRPFTVIVDRQQRIVESIAGLDEEQAAGLEDRVRGLVDMAGTPTNPEER
jgi:peroxiredoxin